MTRARVNRLVWLALAWAALCCAHMARAEPPSGRPGPAPLPSSLQTRVDALVAEVRERLEAHTGDRAIALVFPLTAADRDALAAEIPDDCPVRVADLVAVDVRFRRADGTDGFGRLIVAKHFSARALEGGRHLHSGYWKALRRIRNKRDIARELAALFVANYRARHSYPIQHVIPLHYFRELADERGVEIDDLSMQHNNTYAFAARRVIGTRRWSRHAIGALDINPFYNPFILRTDKGKAARIDMDGLAPDAIHGGLITVSPPGSEAYAFNRSALTDPHVLRDAGAFVVQYLAKRGWSWGGAFRTMKDYHHLAPR